MPTISSLLGAKMIKIEMSNARGTKTLSTAKNNLKPPETPTMTARHREACGN